MARCQLVFWSVCCLKNVSLSEECGKPAGSRDFSYLFLPSFSLSFFYILDCWCRDNVDGGGLFSLELELAFGEWRRSNCGCRILESAFSAAGLHTKVSQNGLQCAPTRTALFSFGRERLRMPARRRLYSSSVRIQRAGLADRIWEPKWGFPAAYARLERA